MSVSEQITRLTNARDSIRSKLVEFGLATTTDNFDTLATVMSGIEKRAVSATVLEGSTYTIPKGYHDGTGTVTGLTDTAGDAERYKLQTKTVIPTKSQQAVSPDSGYYGLSSVSVSAIPEQYKDASSADVTADDVLLGKNFVGRDGLDVGKMPNNAGNNVAISLSGSPTGQGENSRFETAIPKGYYNGTGNATVKIGSITHTPDKAGKTYTANATSGLYYVVNVDPIPDNYADTTDATATAEHIYAGKTAYIGDSEGNAVQVTGTMTANSPVTTTLDTSTTSYTIPQGYHGGLGKVQVSTQDKSATPTKSTQTITADTGKVLKKVTVNAIPASYQNVTSVTATADQVLDGAVFVTSAGVSTEGTMVNNGAVSASIVGLTSLNDTYTIPQGYHDGTGTVSLASDIETALAAL